MAALVFLLCETSYPQQAAIPETPQNALQNASGVQGGKVSRQPENAAEGRRRSQ
ncbi:hypothetical protein ACEF96_001861 [Salmonella enterica]